MIRNILTIILLSFTYINNVCAKECVVTSPNGKLKVLVSDGNGLTWSITADGDNIVLAPSAICIKTDKGGIDSKTKIKKVTQGTADKTFKTPVYSRIEVRDHYNWLKVELADGFSVTFRAYDDCGCYRISTKKSDLTIYDETAEFRFTDDHNALIPYINDNRGGERWCYSFESYYDEQRLSGMFADSLAITPLAVCLPDGRKAVVMDAGVDDYPGMYLVKAADNTLKAEFPPYPIKSEIGGFSRLNLVPTQRAGFLAKTTVPRDLPWRAVVFSRDDTDLINTDIAQCLAPECRLDDVSWIRPGKVAWDWWNNTNLTGVDFEAGINTDTYKYFIDFAQRNHLEYIIIDEGWSDAESLMILQDKIDLKELLRYAKAKGVGIILWSTWRNLIKDMDNTMAHYASMGVAGFKVDFFDRDDQEVIHSAYKVAECAARHHLLLDMHGLKPFGIQRAYPNILNFEGVKGLENSKWEPRTATGPLHDQPRYDVTIPFLRMLPGPLDYTPGAMVNATKDHFFGNNNHPMSQGTRAHQAAMYAIFSAPLQMLADSPTKYEREQQYTDVIASVPTTFDETVALDGKIGEYVVVARRKGNTWYIGAMTNWQERDLSINISKLGIKNNGHTTLLTDGRNAHRDATDYRISHEPIKTGKPLDIHLAPGGGALVIIVDE